MLKIIREPTNILCALYSIVIELLDTNSQKIATIATFRGFVLSKSNNILEHFVYLAE